MFIPKRLVLPVRYFTRRRRFVQNSAGLLARRPAITTLAWGGVWVALLLLASCTRDIPPAQPVRITPLTLTPGATTPTPVVAADWTMYHANPARTGYIPDAPNAQRLTNLWKQPLDG